MTYSKIVQTDEAKSLVSSSLFSLLSINVRSLNAHSDILNQLIDDINSPTVLALQEIWNCKDSSLIIPSYHHVTKMRQKCNGGGVGIWVKSTLKNYSDDSLENLSLNCVEMVHRIIEQNNTKILTISLYRPPNANFQSSLNDFRKILDACDRLQLKTYITGDCNINLLDHNSGAKRYLDVLQSFSYAQLVQAPTRFSKKSITLIDHTLVNDKVQATSYVVNATVADHLAVLTVSNHKKRKPSTNKQEIQSFQTIDSEE